MTSTAHSELRWYCLQTLARKERMAACCINQRTTLEVFAPHHWFYRRTRTGKKRFVEAVFPGYIFVRCAIGRSYRQLLAINGVRGVVRYGSTFPAVGDGFIAELKQACDQASRRPPEPLPRPDDEVEIISGPFASSLARVLSCEDQRRRVRLLLELLGREVIITVGAAHVLARGGDANSPGWRKPLERPRAGPPRTA